MTSVDAVDAAAASRINADVGLRRWGRHLRADVLIDTGERSHLLVVHDGVIVRLLKGPFVMPSWTLALRFDAAAWAVFMRPEPTPGFHDLMALIRRGALLVEGDLAPFMRHLFWFKGLFAAIRDLPP